LAQCLACICCGLDGAKPASNTVLGTLCPGYGWPRPRCGLQEKSTLPKKHPGAFLGRVFFGCFPPAAGAFFRCAVEKHPKSTH